MSDHNGTAHTYFDPQVQMYVQKMKCGCGETHSRSFKVEEMVSVYKGVNNDEYENPVIKDWKLGGRKVL